MSVPPEAHPAPARGVRARVIVVTAQAVVGERALMDRLEKVSSLAPELRARFAVMLRDGALDEVRSVLELGLDPSLPAMRAHGVPELAAYLKGEIPIEQAAADSVSATARYAKRQTTWFRHHRLAEPGALRIIWERYTGLGGQPPTEVLRFVNTLLDRPDHAS